MKKIISNRRLLVFLIVVAVLGASAAAFYVYRKQSIKGNIAAQLPRGLELLEAGEYQDAMMKLGIYVRHHKDNAEAWYAYSRARLRVPAKKGQHVVQAIGALRRVVELEPDHMKARRDLLSIYRQVGYATEAIREADGILKRKPGEWGVMRTKALMLADLRQFRKAFEMSKEIAKAHPDRLENHVFALYVMRQSNRTLKEIVGYAESLQKVRKNDAKSTLVRGVAHRVVEEDDEARVWLKKAALMTDKDGVYVSMLVTQLDGLNEYDTSTEVLRNAAIETDDVIVQRMWAGRLFQTGRIDRVQGRVKKSNGVAKTPIRDPDSSKGGSLLEYVERLEKDGEVDSRILALKGLALGRINRKDEVKSIGETLAQRDDDPAAEIWSSLLLGLSNSMPFDELKTICGKGLTLFPNDPYLLFLMGRAQAGLKQNDSASEYWKRAARIGTVWGTPLVRLAELSLSGRRYREATYASTLALRRAPWSVDAAVLWALSVSASGLLKDDTVLMKVVGSIQDARPGESRTLPMYLDLLVKNNQKVKATQKLTEVLDGKEAPSEAFLLALSSVSRRLELGLSKALLARSEKEYGLTPSLALIRAVQLREDENAAAGLKLLDDAKPKESEGDNLVLWRLSKAQYLEGIFGKAEQVLTEARKAVKRGLDVSKDAKVIAATASADAAMTKAKDAWIELADDVTDDMRVQQAAYLARSVGQEEAFLDRVIDRMKKGMGDESTVWRMARARWLLGRRWVDDVEKQKASAAEAAEILNEVVKLSPNNVSAHVTLAACFGRLENNVGAIDHLRIASRLQPDSPVIALRLATYLQNAGEFVEAKPYLDRLDEMRDLSPAMRRRAAVLWAIRGDTAKGIEVLAAKNADAIEGSSSQDTLLLAEMYQLADAPAQTREMLDKLLNDPENPPSAGALAFAARFFTAVKDDAKAKEMLTKLETQKISESARALLLAEYHASQGKEAETRKYFESAVGVKDAGVGAWLSYVLWQFSLDDIDKTMALCKRAAKALPNEEVFEYVLERESDIREGAKAALIRPLIRSIFVSREYRRVGGVVLRKLVTAQQNKERMSKVAETLVRTADRYPRYLELQNFVASVLIAAGRLDTATRLATRTSVGFPRDPRSAALGMAALTASGRYAESIGIGQRWRARVKKGGGAIKADLAIAGSYARLGQWEQVIKQLEPHLLTARGFFEKSDNVKVIVQYVSALIQLKEFEKAREILLPLGKGRADWRTTWMQYASGLVSDEGVASGWLREIQSLIRKDSPAEKLDMAKAWLRLGMRLKKPEYVKLARKQVAELAKSSGASARVHFAMGNFAEVDQDMKTAEGAYRKALEIDSKDVESMNNLALVLARLKKNLDEAESLARLALAAQPKNANLMDTLAEVFLVAGKKKEAVELLDKARKIQGNLAIWHLRYVRMLAKVGRTDEAKKEFGRLESRLPGKDRMGPQVRRQVETIEQLLRPAKPEKVD